MLFIAIAVILCAAYLLWQLWECDLVDDAVDRRREQPRI